MGLLQGRPIKHIDVYIIKKFVSCKASFGLLDQFRSMTISDWWFLQQIVKGNIAYVMFEPQKNISSAVPETTFRVLSIEKYQVLVTLTINFVPNRCLLPEIGFM